MNRPQWIPVVARLGALLLSGWLLAACAPTPEVPDEVRATRAELTRLQSDPVLAPLVGDALSDAEAAMQLAEQDADAPVTAHRVYVAHRKIEIARALAEARQAEQEREALVAQREQARLDARTRELDSARADAASAQMEADAARAAATEARGQAVALQQQIEAMHARQTERGLMLTLGDVLFETGKADLKPGAVLDLDQLARFLGNYPERSAVIEGHTDSTGSEDFNLALSQRRAESVRAYLVRQGVEPARITATGMGEGAPVASNSTDAGRQQNRRVEVIIND